MTHLVSCPVGVTQTVVARALFNPLSAFREKCSLPMEVGDSGSERRAVSIIKWKESSVSKYARVPVE